MPPDSHPETPTPEPVRFLDILTLASTLARSRADEAVTPQHLLDAILVLTGESTMEDATGPVSPLATPRANLPAHPAATDIAQRWYAHLGGAPDATLTPTQLAQLVIELESLIAQNSG